MIMLKYHIKAFGDAGVYFDTYSRSARKIYSKTYGHKTLRGTLRVVYSDGSHDIADNITDFDGRDDLITAMKLFSETELLEYLAVS